MGEMSAVMAHEIRNPLGSIQGAAEILSDTMREDDKESTERYASILIKEVKRLDDVVTGLIDSSRPRVREKEPVNVESILRDLVYLYAVSARTKDIRIVERYGDNLPEVMADEDMLRQVFVNILLNAIEATGSMGEVTVAATVENGNVIVSIEDTGAGIPDDQVEKIFDLFYTTKESGTGLGLAVSRRVIKEHGGRILMKSQVGKGTAVQVQLPPLRGREED
jgi:signal transduction histidine kinase